MHSLICCQCLSFHLQPSHTYKVSSITLPLFCFCSYQSHFVQTVGFTFLPSIVMLKNYQMQLLARFLLCCSHVLVTYSWHQPHHSTCTKHCQFCLLIKTCSFMCAAIRHAFILHCGSMCVTEYVIFLVCFVFSSAGLVNNVAGQKLSACVCVCVCVCVRVSLCVNVPGTFSQENPYGNSPPGILPENIRVHLMTFDENIPSIYWIIAP